jgi:pimeloyl-ACP methyl ester carboxylesterase
MGPSIENTADSSMPPRRKRRWLRWTTWFLVSVFGVLCLLAAAGAVYNTVATARDRRRFPPPGRLISVNSLRLHLDCQGAGSPTVVFEGDLGDPALEWRLVQPEVARVTRACSYDRAGLGYSDEPPNDRPRDGRALARELHDLLRLADVTGPFIVVGHGFGGLLVRLYAAAFPADVSGVVLLDAMHEDWPARFEASLSPAGRQLPSRLPGMRRNLPRAMRANRFGILRLWPALSGLDPGAPMYRRISPATLQAFSFLKLQTKALRTHIAVFDRFEETLAQVRATGTLGDRPLVVLAAGSLYGDLSPTDAETHRRLWLGEFQPALARLSTRGRLIIVDDSGHRIALERPDAVVEAARTVIDEVRREGSRVAVGNGL